MQDQSMTFAPIEPTELDRMWIEQHEQLQREIAAIYTIPPLFFDSVDLAKLKEEIAKPLHPQIIYTDHTTPAWIISPKTYESIKLAHNFPLPIRKLRKCKLRRIAQCKQHYRKHRARVNAAIAKRYGVAI